MRETFYRRHLFEVRTSLHGVTAGLALCLACTGGNAPNDASSAGSADYGDAPDERPTGYPSGERTGAFPTRGSSGGAHSLDPMRAWLGRPGNRESANSDGSRPDTDDGVLEMNVEFLHDRPRANLLVQVGSEDPDAEMWLNVLVDLDMNGRWGGEREWVVQNQAIDFQESDKKVHSVQVPAFAYGDEKPPTAAWMRVALTDRTVPPNWDGTGSFERGEIEDYLVELPKGDQPAVAASCDNPDTHSGAWGFDGANHVKVRCTLTPVSGSGGQVHFDFERRNGGTTHSALCPGQSLDAASTEAHVSGGPVRLGKGPTSLECLFNRAGRLPSEWELRIDGGSARSRVSNTGIVLGLGGALSTTFKLEKGGCDMECSARKSCFGSKECRGGCCVEAWAPECAELEPEACGRCCAITGGRSAGDCVRQACAL